MKRADSSTWPAKTIGADHAARADRMLSRELPHDMLLASRHRQLLVQPAEHHDPVTLALIVHAFETADRSARDEAVAVDAHEAIVELLLELGQRLLEQELAGNPRLDEDLSKWPEYAAVDVDDEDDELDEDAKTA